MSTMTTPLSSRRAISLALAGAVLAACGGSSGDGSDAVATPTSPASAEAFPETLPEIADDPDAWASTVSSAYDDLQQARSEAALRAVEAVAGGAHRLDWTQGLYEAEVAAIDTFLAAVPESPDAGLAASDLLDDLVASIGTVREAAATGLELGAADPDGVRAELDSVGDRLPESEFGMTYVDWGAADAGVFESCFALQAELDTQQLDIPDCTGSGVDASNQQGEADDDPTTDETGFFASARLDPGIHDFSVFGPGLVIDTADVISVSTYADAVEIDRADGLAGFVIVDPQNIVDPATFADDPADQTYGSLPDDFESWVEALPSTIVDDGTVGLPGGDARYFVLQHNPEASIEKLGEVGFAIFGTYNGTFDDESPAVFGLVPDPEAPLGLLEWNRGDDRLLVFWVYGGDDTVELIETILTTAE